MKTRFNASMTNNALITLKNKMIYKQMFKIFTFKCYKIILIILHSKLWVTQD